MAQVCETNVILSTVKLLVLAPYSIVQNEKLIVTFCCILKWPLLIHIQKMTINLHNAHFCEFRLTKLQNIKALT